MGWFNHQLDPRMGMFNLDFPRVPSGRPYLGKGNHRQFVGPGNSVAGKNRFKSVLFYVMIRYSFYGLFKCVCFVEPFCLLKRHNTTTDFISLFTSNI